MSAWLLYMEGIAINATPENKIIPAIVSAGTPKSIIEGPVEIVLLRSESFGTPVFD